MAFWWTGTLVVYGLVTGWDQIHPLSWWLILTFGIQDCYDISTRVKK